MTLQLSENHIGHVTRTPKENFCHNVRKYLREYTEVTGIDGLRYVTEKRSIVEKIVWVIVLLLSLTGCIYMIYEIKKKYENCPVVVSFATRDTPIYKIPFPSVTICPESKFSGIKFNYSDVYYRFIENETLTETEFQNLYYTTLLCDDSEEIELYGRNNETMSDDFFQVIDKLKPEGGMFCSFMGNDYEFSELFIPIIIDEGICYSFNILDRKELFRDHVFRYSDYHVENDSRSFDFESGYVENAGIDTYPRRALMSGADNALDIIFQHEEADTDYACNSYLEGYRILIHNPADVPRLSKHYFRVPLDKVVVAAIRPELVITSDAVKNFTPEKRNCYLRSERSLKHFKMYTQSNCLLECVTNFTLNKCGCVHFSMPRENSTVLCGLGSINCLEKAESELKIKELENKITGSSKTDCDCKPSCTDLSFDVETSHSRFNWREYFANPRTKISVDNRLDDLDEHHFSVLSIYFKSEQFMTLERNELYGVSDLISNFGGLLSLFTGFSLISLIEIVYFLTLRIFYNERLYGRWSGSSHN